jgi:hypothetical protein
MDERDGQKLYDTQAIVDILKGLQEKVDNASRTSVLNMLAPFPVFLWDVCNAFELSEQECDKVLGRSASFVKAWFGGKPEPLPK